MRVRGERDAIGRVVQQTRKAAPHLVGLLECVIPNIVNQLSGIEPRLLLGLKCDIRPGLMRMAGEQDALSDAEPCVVLGELCWIDHSSERIAQRSGHAGSFRVFIRYSAPLDPPVPAFVPIVRCTIFTCRYRHSMNPSSRSTSRSAIWATLGFFL